MRGDVFPFKVLKSFPPVGSGILEKMIRNSPKLLCSDRGEEPRDSLDKEIMGYIIRS